MSSRRASRTSAGLLGVVLATVMLVACGGPDDGDEVPQPSADSEARNAAIAGELQESFSQLPGVTSVEVNYQDNLTSPGSIAVRTQVGVGTEYGPLFDAMTEQIWLSELDPLNTIALSAGDGGSPPTADSRTLTPSRDADFAALENQYGPRPG